MGPERTLPAVLRPKWLWTVFWMRFAGLGRFGRFATRLAACFAPPYKAQRYLAGLHPRGYVSPTAQVHGVHLERGANVFIGDRVILYGADAGAGPIVLGDRVHLHQETIVEVGGGGRLEIGADTHVQPRCLFAAYRAPIRIGRDVQIAAYCCFYPYDHHFAPGQSIMAQPLKTKGGIVIEDGAWLGARVTLLDGAHIGQGAVIGAGAVVRGPIPAGAIAVGVPARVVCMRSDWRRDADNDHRPSA